MVPTENGRLGYSECTKSVGACRLGVPETLGALGKGTHSDKKARNHYPLLHATQTSTTLLFTTNMKFRA